MVVLPLVPVVPTTTSSRLGCAHATAASAASAARASGTVIQGKLNPDGAAASATTATAPRRAASSANVTPSYRCPLTATNRSPGAIFRESQATRFTGRSRSGRRAARCPASNSRPDRRANSATVNTMLSVALAGRCRMPFETQDGSCIAANRSTRWRILADDQPDSAHAHPQLEPAQHCQRLARAQAVHVGHVAAGRAGDGCVGGSGRRCAAVSRKRGDDTARRLPRDQHGRLRIDCRRHRQMAQWRRRRSAGTRVRPRRLP